MKGKFLNCQCHGISKSSENDFPCAEAKREGMQMRRQRPETPSISNITDAGSDHRDVATGNRSANRFDVVLMAGWHGVEVCERMKGSF